MLKYYAEASGSNGRVSYLRENLSGEKLASALNTTKDIRHKIFGMLEDICTELILKPGCDDDFDAIKTETGSVVFKEGFGGQVFDFKDENKLFSHLKSAKDIHDLWEKVYISAMDFDKAGELAERASKNLIAGRCGTGGKNVNRFFGSMVPGENVNFIDNLTEGFEKRIFIKGRPGTGKSTLLKKVRSDANAAGFDTETYLCSFDPQSLDMVIIRELSVCIFDSTAPHEKFPERPGDEILDVYSYAVKSGTDEENEALLTKYSRLYSDEIKKAKESPSL